MEQLSFKFMKEILKEETINELNSNILTYKKYIEDDLVSFNENCNFFNEKINECNNKIKLINESND